MENELFEHAPVPKAYFTMALPVVMGMVVNLVYNIVDTFFIARTQNAQLVAGVSLCAPIFTLMIALGDIFGLGGSSLISRLFGEKKDEEGKRASGFCFYAAILCGVLVTILLLLLKTPVLHLLGATDETIGYAGQYYQYLALGAPFIIVALTPSNLIRTEGLALQSMAATILGAVVNIILDPVFIFGLNMGAGGAAIATVIGNAASVVLLIYFVRMKSRKLTVSPKNIKISGAAVASILAIGIPASVTNIMQSFGIALTNRFLAGYGTEKVAAMGIAMKVNMIVVLVMVGFAFGAQPLLGYNYGAGNKKRLKEFIRFDLMVEIGFAIVCALVLALLAPQFVRLFMKDRIDRSVRKPDAALSADLITDDRSRAGIYDAVSGGRKSALCPDSFHQPAGRNLCLLYRRIKNAARLYGRDLCAGSFRCDHRCDRAGAVLEIHAEKLRKTQKERSCEQQA